MMLFFLVICFSTEVVFDLVNICETTRLRNHKFGIVTTNSRCVVSGCVDVVDESSSESVWRIILLKNKNQFRLDNRLACGQHNAKKKTMLSTLKRLRCHFLNSSFIVKFPSSSVRTAAAAA